MDYIWGASMVDTCLQMMIDLWEMRNKDVHYGKEEATKQHRRKKEQPAYEPYTYYRSNHGRMIHFYFIQM